MHLPLGSVLVSPEERVVEGAGSAPGSDPPGSVQSTLTRSYTLDTLHPPIPRGRSLLGTSSACYTLRGRGSLLPLASHALSHPAPLAGARAGSRRGKRDLKRGVPVPVPPASRSPRLAPAAAAAPAPCPPSATSSQPGSAQAPEPPFSSPKEATIEKSSEREGHLYTHFRHSPTPLNP